MTAPLHERLAEAASKANQDEWHLRIGDEWSKSIVTVHGEMENGEPSVWTLIDVNLRRDEAEETLRYLQACQPSAVAELCEQVRMMREAIELLLCSMQLAGWEGDHSAIAGRAALERTGPT